MSGLSHRIDVDNSLLAQQKANLKLSASQPGKSLLNRLARPNKPSTPLNKSVAGGDKVNRAKARAVSGQKMDVDRPAPKEKFKAKTQEELDEEMRAYEMQRRFAA